MNAQTITALTGFIQQVGFPIFVAVVLLWRVETMHVENIRTINALTDAVWALTGKRPHPGGNP